MYKRNDPRRLRSAAENSGHPRKLDDVIRDGRPIPYSQSLRSVSVPLIPESTVLKFIHDWHLPVFRVSKRSLEIAREHFASLLILE